TASIGCLRVRTGGVSAPAFSKALPRPWLTSGQSGETRPRAAAGRPAIGAVPCCLTVARPFPSVFSCAVPATSHRRRPSRRSAALHTASATEHWRRWWRFQIPECLLPARDHSAARLTAAPRVRLRPAPFTPPDTAPAWLPCCRRTSYARLAPSRSDPDFERRQKMKTTTTSNQRSDLYGRVTERV